MLRFLSVLPLGGNNITRDITALQMEEAEAEQLKKKYGDMLYEEEETETPAVCTLEDGRNIELNVLNDIIDAPKKSLPMYGTSFNCQDTRINYYPVSFSPVEVPT